MNTDTIFTHLLEKVICFQENTAKLPWTKDEQPLSLSTQNLLLLELLVFQCVFFFHFINHRSGTISVPLGKKKKKKKTLCTINKWQPHKKANLTWVITGQFTEYTVVLLLLVHKKKAFLPNYLKHFVAKATISLLTLYCCMLTLCNLLHCV